MSNLMGVFSHNIKSPKQLVAGDKTEWYTVNKVTVTEKTVVAEVTYNDGGTGKREWDIDSATLLEVK